MKMYLKHFSCVSLMVIAWSLMAGCASKQTASDASEERQSSQLEAKTEQKSAPQVPALDGLAESTSTVQVIPANKQREYAQAITLIKSNEWQQAEQIIHGLLRNNPNVVGLHANIGVVYYKTERFDEAEQAFIAAIALHRHPAIVNYLGSVYRQQGRFEDARSMYESTLNIDETYANAQLNLGILHDLYLRDYKAALVHYTRYMDMKPKNMQQDVKLWIADLQRRTAERTADAN